jgi:hypothetical protein
VLRGKFDILPFYTASWALGRFEMRAGQMDQDYDRIVSKISDFKKLAQFELNAEKYGALSEGLKKLIDHRSGQLGRAVVRQQTGKDLAQT